MEIEFHLSTISSSVTAFFFACTYTGPPLYSLLEAAAIIHFYSLVTGTHKVNRRDAGCF